jgi:uncharacterized protein
MGYKSEPVAFPVRFSGLALLALKFISRWGAGFTQIPQCSDDKPLGTAMQYRRFGRTDWQISVLSLGTMRCLESAAQARSTLQAAIAAGINHIETAPAYGASETYLGQALAAGEIDRSQLYITSKVLPSLDAAATMASIAQSLARLQVDYLDGLAIHGINTPEHLDWVSRPDGCMAAVRAAVAAGKVRQVGFSTHGDRAVIEAAIATEQFAFVNLHYGIFFQRNQTAIDLAAAQDMGIFIISTADKAGLLYTPPETLVQLCAPLSPLELNYRFLLSDPRITTLSVGPAVPEELRSPLDLVQDVTAVNPLRPAEQAILTRLQRHQTEQLGATECHQCHACLPCPEQINIPTVLRLRNLAIAYDMQAFGEYRYGMFERAGHWFPGRRGDRCTDCGDCLPRCPSQLAIPDLLRDAHDRLKGKARRRLWQD